MNVYKEIFIEFENLTQCPHEEIYLNNNQTPTRRSPFLDTKKRGFVFSLPHVIVYCQVDYNIMYLTFIKLNSEKNDLSQYFMRKLKINFSDLILDNIHHIEDFDMHSKYIFMVFLNNGEIFQLNIGKIFDKKLEFSSYQGTFNSSLEIIVVENLRSDLCNHYYALGSSSGKFYVYKLSAINSKLESTLDFEYNNSYISLTKYIGSLFTKEKFNSGISNLRYIGNSLIAFVTYDFNFHLFSFFSNKVILKKPLLKNKVNDVIKNSKINYITNEDDDHLITKSFFFAIYMEYEDMNVQVTFEIWFSNTQSETISQFDNSIVKNLGDEVKISNFRIYNLKGKLVDMIAYTKKLWIVTELLSRDNSISYDFMIISLTNQGKYTTTINFSEMKLSSTFLSIAAQLNYMKDDKKLGFLHSLLSNEEYFSNESLINFWNLKGSKITSQYDYKFTNFNKKSELLDYIMGSNNREKNINMMEDLLTGLVQEIQKNEIICLGAIYTESLDSLIILRSNGISFVKQTGKFEYLNELISIHESKINDIIFDRRNYTISKNVVENYKSIKNTIFNYVVMNQKQKEDNHFYIVLGLLRLSFSENFLKTSDIAYINKYFNENLNKDFNNFIEEHFVDTNNLNCLEFLNEFIYSILVNNSKIKKGIEKILKHFEEYFTSLYNFNHKHCCLEKSHDFMKFNNKYCELINKLILEKVRSMYNLSRDLFLFILWMKKYSQLELINPDTNLSNEINFPQIVIDYYDRVKRLFIDCFSALILFNSEINIKKVNTEYISFVDKGSYTNFNITYSQQVLYQSLCNYGNRIFVDFKNNKIIDYLISGIWPSFNLLEEKRNRLECYFKLCNYDDNLTLRTLLIVQGDPALEDVFYSIVTNANLGYIEQLKDNLSLFYSLVNNSAEFDNFKFFLSENKLCTKSLRENRLENNTLLAYKCLEEILSNILKDENHKFQFFHHSSFYISPYFDKNDKRISSEYLYHMFQLSMRMDIDSTITCIISIKNEEIKKRAFEEFIDFICMKKNIDTFSNYRFDKSQMNLIISILESKSLDMIKNYNFSQQRYNTTTEDEIDELMSPNLVKINYLEILISLLIKNKQFYSLLRVVHQVLEKLEMKLESDSFNFKDITLILSDINKSFKQLKLVEEFSNLNFIKLVISDSKNLHSRDKAFNYLSKFQAKYFLCKWNNRRVYSNELVKNNIDNLNQKVLTNEELLVSFICSENFELDFIDFIFENKYYLYYLSKEHSQLLLNIFENYIKLMFVKKYESTKSLDELFDNHIPIIQFTSKFREFINEILNILDKEWSFEFIEIMLSKSIRPPQLIIEYLMDNNPLNLMRIFIKYGLLEESLNCAENLIENKLHYPYVELNIIKKYAQVNNLLKKKSILEKVDFYLSLVN